jgi:AraC family transcriptional activator of mtrCDE
MSLLDRLLSSFSRYGEPDWRRRRGRATSTSHHEAATVDRLLATLEAEIKSFAICEVAPGDSLLLQGVEQPFFHYVLKGTGILRVEGGGDVTLAPHTFIIVPARRAQVIETRKGAGKEVQAMDSSIAIVDHMLRMSSSDRALAEVITTCGTIEASYSGSARMFDHLDRPFALQLEEGDSLRQAFEALLDELASPRLGTRALTEALLKQCLILLIRKIVPDSVEAQWLFGMADARLLSAVLAMVDNPAESFTVDRLAKTAGMSRSSFAAQFQTTFGTTPIEFLKRIRLRHAARLLERTDLPIEAISRSIGYESRTYFSRAFSDEFGVSPRGFRSQSRGSGSFSEDDSS